jgi:branched-chain amino acid transport system permease protein
MNFNRRAQRQLLIGLLLAAGGVAAGFYFDNYKLQVFTSLAMACTLCWGWNIVGGYMGYPALGTIAFFGVGAYVGAIGQGHGLPAGVAWLLAAVAGAVLALITGYALLRLKGHYFAIGTIATVEVFREVCNNLDSVTGGAIGLNLPILQGTPEYASRYFFFSMLALAVVAFVATVLMDCSKFGFGLRCIRQNEKAASMVGMDVFAYKVSAYVLSGVLSATAGAIYASMVGFIEPKDAFNLLLTIEVPVMVMLGGMGTVFGPLVGAIAYVVLREFVWAYFINWHSGLLGIIIVGVIYFLPKGALGIKWKALASSRKKPAQTNIGIKGATR